MKRRPVHRNLNTSFVDLPALIGLLRRQKFTGVVHLETKNYEADVLLNGEDEPLARERDLTAGRISVGDGVLERLLVRAREPGGTVNVYEGVKPEHSGPAEPPIPKPFAALPDKPQDSPPAMLPPDRAVPEPMPKTLPEITAESPPAIRQPDTEDPVPKPKNLPEITADSLPAIVQPDTVDRVPKPKTLPEITAESPPAIAQLDTIDRLPEPKALPEITAESPPAIVQPDTVDRVPKPKTLPEIPADILPAMRQPDTADPVLKPKTLPEITGDSSPAIAQLDTVDRLPEPKSLPEITADSLPAIRRPDNIDYVPKPKTEISVADSPAPTMKNGEVSPRKTGVSLRSKPIKMGRSSTNPLKTVSDTSRVVEEPKTRSAFEYLKEKLSLRNLPFSFSNRVEEKSEQKAAKSGEDWDELLDLVGELLGTCEKCLGGSNLNFAWVFEKVRIDLSTDYPFLHPHSDFFEYGEGKIKMNERIKPQLLIAGIAESLRKLTEKLEAYPKFDKVRELIFESIRELMRKRRTQYDKFSLTMPLKRVIGI